HPAVIASSIERYRFREAQNELMNVARLGNKYLADAEPWKTFKTDPERTKTVMYIALQIAGTLAVLSEPFLPHTAKTLKQMLNIESEDPLMQLPEPLSWEVLGEKIDLLPVGHSINKAALLFSKIEDEQIQKQLDKLEATKMSNQAENTPVTPQKDTIEFDDFTKLDLRVGTILEAEKMAKTKKLLILKVDTGLDVRTIVSGIAESFKPEDIIGKQVTVVANLAPRKLRGVESQGMILMTEDKQGKLVFMNPDTAGVKNGEAVS
ncbi:MAG TPA: methionine--tRNA ligase subunit beta, partial [Leeuwenhoekiella sp.]|nr:methionine--tRNA ligase subunit beta [Leeuwenhoekiella sp.]